MPTHFHQKPNLYTSHVQLKVSNLARSIDYYTTVLGFKVLQQSDEIVYLTTDGKSSFLSLIEVQQAQPLREGFTGLYHIALLLPTRKDLGNIVQHFVELNIRLGASDHDVSEALYLNDPDGNGIEIYVDRNESEWTWNEDGSIHMSTDRLNFQPILAEADGQWTGLPEETILGHVHLSVANIAQSETFYTNVLQYNVVARYGKQALFISTGRYHHHFGLNTWHSNGGEPPTANMVGLHSFTITLHNELAATQLKTILETNGYIPETALNAPKFGGQPLFSVLDPNGLRIIVTIEEN